MIETPPNLIRPEVQLVGTDGNAFSVIGTVRNALRKAGNSNEVCDQFMKEAMMATTIMF